MIWMRHYGYTIPRDKLNYKYMTLEQMLIFDVVKKGDDPVILNENPISADDYASKSPQHRSFADAWERLRVYVKLHDAVDLTCTP